MSTITERVAAGAAFLDEHDPQWWRADVERPIDLNEMDLGNSRWCVLGQRCPVEVLAAAGVTASMYSAYAATLSGIALDDRGLDAWAAAHGFQLKQDETPLDAEGDDYDALTAEWKRVITERRAAIEGAVRLYRIRAENKAAAAKIAAATERRAAQ